MRLRIQKSTTEQQLAQRCAKQDPKAQREVYQRYSPLMLSVCMRYIKDESEAEETMINGFMKVFEKVDQFGFSGSFEGWIRRIMVNEALMYLRRHRNMNLAVDVEAADLEPDYNSLSDHLEAEDLLNLIQELPVGYRTVFNLYAIEGYSHKEIAERLDITENTSKSQLSRARTLLQQQLSKMEGTGPQASHLKTKRL